MAGVRCLNLVTSLPIWQEGRDREGIFAMFNQTFVNGPRKTRSLLTIAGSLLLQIMTIGAGILVPLVYTKTLPVAQLRSLFVGPSPPVAVIVKPQEPARMRTIAPRLFSPGKLVAPKATPRGVHKVTDLGAPPDIGVPGGMDSADGVNNALLAMTPNIPAGPEPAAAAKPKARTGTIHIGGMVAEANLIRSVQPVYPPLAKIARVQGAVEFTAIISKDGRVENLQVVSGSPLLIAAARDAILQWRYRPTLLNGEPVEVVTTIVVNFALNPGGEAPPRHLP